MTCKNCCLTFFWHLLGKTKIIKIVYPTLAQLALWKTLSPSISISCPSWPQWTDGPGGGGCSSLSWSGPRAGFSWFGRRRLEGRVKKSVSANTNHTSRIIQVLHPSPPALAWGGPGRPSVKHSESVHVLWEFLSRLSNRFIAASWLKMHSQGSYPPPPSSAMTSFYCCGNVSRNDLSCNAIDLVPLRVHARNFH